MMSRKGSGSLALPAALPAWGKTAADPSQRRTADGASQKGTPSGPGPQTDPNRTARTTPWGRTARPSSSWWSGRGRGAAPCRRPSGPWGRPPCRRRRRGRFPGAGRAGAERGSADRPGVVRTLGRGRRQAGSWGAGCPAAEGAKEVGDGAASGGKRTAALKVVKGWKVGAVKAEARAKRRGWACGGRIRAGRPWSVSWKRLQLPCYRQGGLTKVHQSSLAARLAKLTQ
jgi:hypothetical protein